MRRISVGKLCMGMYMCTSGLSLQVNHCQSPVYSWQIVQICILLVHPWRRGIGLIFLHFDHFASFLFMLHFLIYGFNVCGITIPCIVCLNLHTLPVLALVSTDCNVYHYWATANKHSSKDRYQCSSSAGTAVLLMNVWVWRWSTKIITTL